MFIRLFHILDHCRTLGPGIRSVLWTAGCSIRCDDCIAKPLWDKETGADFSIENLVERIVNNPQITGVTISGGEPFDQAKQLVKFVTAVREKRDLSVMIYTGRRLDDLTDEIDKTLLSMTDILVDGPYIPEHAGDFLWRGSSNQDVHFLTKRYDFLKPYMEWPGVGVEIHVSPAGETFWAGIPTPGFTEELERKLAEKGIDLRDSTGGLLT